ncbi:uncharacterized protein VP01_79g7 [Puccinia sorghi]|uniref:Uncharacterized protein n=1 Tax=Puccinia sorghi TaxID=27349 RepID=A0A0L6UBF8_9BASI|nr:uncharacterized protein VP01_79g7 [Puccinia sorghi]
MVPTPCSVPTQLTNTPASASALSAQVTTNNLPVPSHQNSVPKANTTLATTSVKAPPTSDLCTPKAPKATPKAKAKKTAEMPPRSNSDGDTKESKGKKFNHLWTSKQKAHPKRKLATLRTNSIQWYELTHSLFTGTYATGKNVLLPGVNPTEDTENYPTTENTSPNNYLSHLKKKKQLVDSSSDEDTVEVIRTHRPPPPKRVRGSKYDIFQSGVESLVGAIRETGSHPKDDIKSTVNKNSMGLSSGGSLQSQALQKLLAMFLDEMTTTKYVRFVKVLENDANAEVLVSLAETTNPMVCKAWLEDTITKMEQS